MPTIDQLVQDVQTIFQADIFTIPSGPYLKTPVYCRNGAISTQQVQEAIETIKRDQQEIAPEPVWEKMTGEKALKHWQQYSAEYCRASNVTEPRKFNAVYEWMLVFYLRRVANSGLPPSTEHLFTMSDPWLRCGQYRKIATENIFQYREAQQLRKKMRNMLLTKVR